MRTIPSPRTNTSVFAVPRSIARSSENYSVHRLNKSHTPIASRSTTFPVEALVLLSHRPACQAVTSNGNSKERLFVDSFGSRLAFCISSRCNEADERIGSVQTNNRDGLESAFHFDLEHPASVHLQEDLRVYVLSGAMHTAAGRATSPAAREPQSGRDVHSMRSRATRYHTTATFIAMTTSFGHDTRRVSSTTSRGMKAAVAITVT